MRSSATPIRRPPRRPHRARPDAARSTLGQLLAPDLSLTLRSMGPSESLRRPGNRRPRVPRSHGPPEGRVNAAKVDIWLTSRRPASASDVRLTFGQPLTSNPSLNRWSMRLSESARRPGNWLHGVPRSHGPAEERVNRAKVDIRLTAHCAESASDVPLTFGEPLVLNLFLSSWSMRPWESARRPHNWRQGFPRSHGPPEGRVDGAKVDIRLTTRRPAAASDAARAPAPGPVARDGRVRAQPSAPPRTYHARGRALTEIANASAR